MSGRTVPSVAFRNARIQSIFAVFVVALIAWAAALPPVHAAEGFRHQGLDGDAQRFEVWLKANFKAAPETFSQHMTQGRRLMKAGKDMRGAARAFSQAVVANPDAEAGWRGVADALLALPVDKLSGSERYRLPVNASAAAYRAYQKATGDDARGEALVVLSRSLQRRSYWRPAIDAMRRAVAIRGDDTTRKALADLVAVHGFRITNYRVENEADKPRLCISFSEPIKGGDVSDFVAVDGKPADRLNVVGNQLCLSGFAHGKSYEVLVRSGLASLDSEALQKNAELQIYVRDRSPAVRFTGRRYVLPSKGQRGLPVVTVNAEAVDVEIFRVGDRGLVQAVMNGDLSRPFNRWTLNELRTQKGQRVYKGQLKVRSKLNEEVTSAIPVGEALEVLEPGVYAAVAWADARALESGEQLATQWFIVSDLGLTAYKGRDGLHAFVRSLASATPMESARVSLVARNNEVLGEAVTTSGGYARFAAGLVKGEDGLEPAVMVVRGKDGDYAFLDLTSGAFDLSDRGVEGRAAPGPVDGFVYLDRGVYRPGESVQISALVRDANGRAAAAPVTLIVRRPDGVEHRRMVMRDGQLGGFTQALALDDGAMTGTWRLQLHVDPSEAAIAQSAFQVEDFVPERLALDLTAESAFVGPGKPGMVAVAGRYLYGPPAADLAIEGDVIVQPDPDGLKAYPGYTFGLQGRQITPAREALGDAGRTGPDGTAKVAVRLPAIERTARPLRAKVQLRLKEPGGRVIERSVSMPVRTGTPRIGIKALFDGGTLGDGEPARFEVIAIDEDDQRTAMAGLKWELVRLNRTWQWYRRDGGWRYEAITIPEKVGEGTFDAGAGKAFEIEQEVTWGRYRLDVSRVDGALIASSVRFAAGWYQSGDEADSPEILAVALDKARYGKGETAKLKIQSRTAGTAMIAIFANGLVSARDVALGAGDSEIDIPVDTAWGTGAYVVATLYRTLDETSRRMPGRAIGVAWLGLDQGGRTLDVTLSAPEKIRSGTKLTVPIAVGGVGEDGTARVTVAAVDVGVLNLTRFQSPEPSRWFYAQPVLGAEIRDLYGRLIDGMSAERGRLVSGGDADTRMGLQGSPPVEETVALFSGIVAVENGQATVTFDMPDFNGAVRLMAVAWSGDKVGEASQSVIVRDPVAVTVTVPRFLTLGDEASLQIALHNVELDDAELSVTVARTYAGGRPEAVVERTVQLQKGARGAERVVVKPDRLGRVTYDVFVAGPDGLDIGRDYVFDVKAPAMDVRRHVRRELKPGEAYTLPADLMTGLVQGDARVSLSAGPGAELNVPTLLAQLDRYPYGCAEQTISRALPLLYANDLSVDRGLTTDTALRGRIETAIERVFQMQDSSGAFGAWGPGSDIWLSAYVTDFLTRAKEAGYRVDPRGFAQALARLQNYIAYVSDFKRGGQKRAYALYVLARNGKAPIGELRYYADTRLDRFATPLAKAQIGAALAMAGDRERAERAIGAAFDDLGDVGGQTLRRDYGSGLRDAAAVLTMASEANVHAGRVGAVASRIGQALSERGRTSTQEQAWLLLAARALTERDDDVQLSLGGTAYKGAVRLPIEPAQLVPDGNGAGLVLTNTGREATGTFLTVVGSALTPEPAHESGFKIKRSYYTLDGEAVDLDTAGATLKQSDRLVVVLTIEAKDPAGRVLLVDRLAAGLEIENPRLVEGGDIKSLSWFKPGLRPNHTEFRDDRFVASFDFLAAGAKVRSASVAYIVRAVTPGRFVHPAAMVEDMYRPELYARTGGGTLQIRAE